MKTFVQGNFTDNRLVIYLPKDVFEWIRARAYDNHQSMSAFVRRALILMKQDWEDVHIEERSEEK